MNKINKNLFFISFSILFIIFLYRVFFAFFFYGGSDSTGVNSFAILFDYKINIYSVTSHWPYFPLSNNFLILSNIIANKFTIETIQIYKSLTTFFDFLLSCFIFSYWVKEHSVKKSLLVSSLYLINPASVIIVTILGFNDSIFLYFLILSIFLLKSDKNNFFSIIFLCISISFKPVSLILIPYYLYKSKSPIYIISLIILFLFLFNFYYLYEFGLENFYDLIKYIAYKIIYGHQLSGLGISYFKFIFSFEILKVMTIIGILITLSVYIQNLKSDKYYFISIIFISLILFRYNAHPQYFIWSIPFLFFTKYWKLGVWFSLISGFTIFAYTFHWNKNGASFIVFEYFINIFANESVYASDFVLKITNFLYSIGNIFCLLLAIKIIQLRNIYNSISNIFLKTFLLIYKINFLKLFFNIFILIIVIILIIKFNREFLYNYNLFRSIIFLFIPIIFIAIISSTKSNLNFRFFLFYIFINISIVIFAIIQNSFIDILNYLILFFLLINIKPLINTFYFNLKVVKIDD